MTRFKYSLLYGLVVVLTTPFHYEVERRVLSADLRQPLQYAVLALMAALLLIAGWRAFSSRKLIDLAAWLCALLVLAYFLIQKRALTGRLQFGLFLHVAEFFFLGFLLFKENRRAFSLTPFLILVVLAFAFELVQEFLPGRVFDAQDVWLNAISGFCGLIVGYF